MLAFVSQFTCFFCLFVFYLILSYLRHRTRAGNVRDISDAACNKLTKPGDTLAVMWMSRWCWRKKNDLGMTEDAAWCFMSGRRRLNYTTKRVATLFVIVWLWDNGVSLSRGAFFVSLTKSVCPDGALRQDSVAEKLKLCHFFFLNLVDLVVSAWFFF